MTLGVLCTEPVAIAAGDRIRAVADDVEIVTIGDDGSVPADARATVEIAYFSSDAYPDRVMPVMGAILDTPSLRWLHTFSAGVDHPVFDVFLQRGVRLSTSSGASAHPIARTAIMHLLALSRRLPVLFAAQRDRRWSPFRFDELEGGRLAVVGMGPIGREVIRLAQALGMDVIGVRRSVRGDEPCETRPIAELHDVLPTVRAVVLAVPLTVGTTGLIDARAFAALPAGAYLVNVARGEIVDETALVEALTSGRLGGAALDVFATEPLPPESPLWDLPNLIITPHSSGMTNQSPARSTGMFVDNLARYVAGQPLVNEVFNPAAHRTAG
jgi:phosphoglycerate dehydrogenase-like enzyme